jgi:glycerol uptake facilitator-like aquaporin
MRPLSVAAILAALTTFVAALALRAPDATVAVLAVAAMAVVVTWLAGQHTTEDESGLALTSPAAALALALVGRANRATLLPLIAAQVVGAVLGGLAANGLDSRLGDTLVFTAPGRLVTGIVVGVLAIIGTWILFAIDGAVNEAYAVVPPILAGAALSLGFTTALNPAVIVGIATASLVPWTVALIAAGAGLVGAVIGAYTMVTVAAPE